MIYRKWSLLTGPPVILGGVVGAVLVVNYIVYNSGVFSKPPANKQEPATSTKL